MLKLKNILFAAGLILLFGFYLGSGNKPSSDTPVALVKKIVKDVTYRAASDVSDWDVAKVGLPLNNGGEVKTGTKSLALVLFTDGSGLLKVRENSILHIYGEKKDKKLNKNTFIQKGLVGFDVNKQEEDEEFKFTTPSVVASIRGTNGFIEHNDRDSITTIFIERGDVGFITSNGSEGSVGSRRTARINPNGTFHVDSASVQDTTTFHRTNRTTIKKLKIQTRYGDLEIEYEEQSNGLLN